MRASKYQFEEWPTDLLIDYALKIHHRGIREKGPEILSLIHSMMGENQLMAEIESLFSECMLDLENHLQKEEQVLFPFTYQLMESQLTGQPAAPIHCGSVAMPIHVMILEHDNETKRQQHLRKLTNNYTPAADASGDYKLLLSLLKNFAEDLNEHVYIENEIIFPRSQLMEQQLLS